MHKRFFTVIQLLAELFMLLILIGTPVFTYAQSSVSLAGNWRFAMDAADRGIAENWAAKILSDNILLPGSMLERGKGEAVTLQTKWTGSIYDSSWFVNPRYAKYRQPDNLKFPFWLTPDKYYVGAAWYQKEINIPNTWKNQHVRLFLERCHTETTLWLDGKKIGMQNSMVAAHDYELPLLGPGKHNITIRIDNRIKEINVGQDSHSLTDHTQGNWNGITGRIELNCMPVMQIASLQTYPDIKNRSVKLRLHITGTPLKNVSLNFVATAFNNGNGKIPAPVSASKLINDTGLVDVDLPLGKNAVLWSEFNPALYKLTATLLTAHGNKQLCNTQFGLRSFAIQGTQFQINGKTTFLRGTVENCVFPLTGYASMKSEDWERIFRICKAYGLNHMRFHSYCPPEAAFDAADRLGFYLQPEGPSWANHGSSLGDGKPIDKFIIDETDQMMQAYGNHPSYCMLAYGNEPRGGKQVEYLTRFINYWKAKDDRRVYTGASVAMSWPLVPANEFMIKSGARNLSWNRQPESETDYTTAIEKFNVPYVAHEMGQWCAFPNFSEIKKYTGPYKAKNFELFKEDLENQGMLDQAEAFLQATGFLQALCYKNEIEKSLRTPGNGGFQLLSLNDYPGQGTALVGLLDAFWDEKGYMNGKTFSRFCNSTVPLLKLPKFVFKGSDSVTGILDISHYGAKDFPNARVFWKAKDEKGKTIKQGVFDQVNIQAGKNSNAGRISFSAGLLSKAGKVKIEAGIEGTGYVNDWDIWVFPQITQPEIDFYETDTLDAKAEKILADGGKVLLQAAGKVIKGKEISQSFTPVFWNTSWFKMRPPHTLGFLVNNKSAAFNDFPTAGHIDLQWWDVINRAQVMHLEDFPKTFRPLVQPIDTWFMNRRLGMLFEIKIGKGKLLVSSLNLHNNLGTRPATVQLKSSLIRYLNSEAFNPRDEVKIEVVRDLFRTASKYVFDAHSNDSPDELKTTSPATGK